MEKVPFNQIQLAELIGKGGFGKVYRGKWKEKEVAIKKLKNTSLEGTEEEEFYREANFMFQYNHPSIVKLFAICAEPSKHCLIMEYFQYSLQKVLRNSNITLDWFPTRLQIALDITEGIKFLHSQNILHRDLKSANILLNSEYRAKICDFGLAAIKTKIETTLPATQKAVSIRWSAIEVINGGSRSKASDMYSYGMVLWEISTRKIPFHSLDNELIVLGLIKEGKKEEIPKDSPLAFLIEQCFQTEPTERQSASSALLALKIVFAKEQELVDQRSTHKQELEKHKREKQQIESLYQSLNIQMNEFKERERELNQKRHKVDTERAELQEELKRIQRERTVLKEEEEIKQQIWREKCKELDVRELALRKERHLNLACF